MLNTWNAVATRDRMFDDVMGSAFGTATSSRTFDPGTRRFDKDNERVMLGRAYGSFTRSYTLPETLDEHQDQVRRAGRPPRSPRCSALLYQPRKATAKTERQDR